jgi:3-phosphoshikimate 1-carboxyvinyltransferase
MAMGFAPLAINQDIKINDIDVVNKSYPTFWEDLKSFGFDILEE